MHTKVSENQFLAAWQQGAGSPRRIAQILGLSVRAVTLRRDRLEQLGHRLPTIGATPAAQANAKLSGTSVEDRPYTPRLHLKVRDAQVIVSSDHHYWPGEITLAHDALIILLKRLKPYANILNGDVMDGARISRHEPLGWVKLPTVIQELDTCKLRTGEMERASPKSKRFWTMGNHCTRYDRRLATEISQFEDVPGMSLKDHFKGWEMSYSVMINEELGEPVMVKHAFRGGLHAIYNNTLHAGISIVTGHLHAQLCRPFTDYRGTRYGVDSGCVADIEAASFSYTMDAPVNWRSGFAVLTFDKAGRLMPPELCEIQRFQDHQRAVFRGEVICERRVKPQVVA